MRTPAPLTCGHQTNIPETQGRVMTLPRHDIAASWLITQRAVIDHTSEASAQARGVLVELIGAQSRGLSPLALGGGHHTSCGRVCVATGAAAAGGERRVRRACSGSATTDPDTSAYASEHLNTAHLLRAAGYKVVTGLRRGYTEVTGVQNAPF
jgi:hypothetical protein